MECGISYVELRGIIGMNSFISMNLSQDPYDNHYNSMTYVMKRAVEIPGFYYFDSEASGDEKEHSKIFNALSLYTRLRIFWDIMVYEYLSHIFVFRWLFNAVRVFLAILDLYPFLALKSFGKKYAYVQIMKPKK